ncbi:MAG: hypothetical protein HY083_10605 [Gammaproteobacteria bacterium]|nr:hypothetical protein [Gammaproteobacteria bacterium]
MTNEDKIDIDALEKKRLRVKAKSENPANSQYGDKLAELLNSRATARDNFVNWIAGLATGVMSLAFSNLVSAPNELKEILLYSGLASFLCIVSAMAFKILLEVRFSALELEVALLKNIWEGHDIRTQLNEMMQSGKEITEEMKQRLLHNMNESLDYLDESNLERLKKPINLKFRLWTYSYWQTLGLFIMGVGLMALYFVKLTLCE